MPGHVCDNCGAVVGADDQFCPSCGAWIDPTTVSPGSSDEEFESFDLSDEPPLEEPTARGPVRLPQQEIQCPSCGSSNPATNRHCEECGARLSQGALPVAPRPAVQTTAGVRAAMAISGILLGVVVIALLFSIMGGDDGNQTTAESTSTTTTSTTVAIAEIPILDATCSVEGLANLQCSNLIDGTTEREYQITWEDLEPDQDVTIDLKFSEPMVITQIIWENLPADSDRYFQNYRAKDITVSDGSTQGLGIRLENQGGQQTVPYASLRTLKLTIQVTDVYAPEPRNNTVFSELAIAEIRVMGYPAAPITTTTTAPTETSEG